MAVVLAVWRGAGKAERQVTARWAGLAGGKAAVQGTLPQACRLPVLLTREVVLDALPAAELVSLPRVLSTHWKSQCTAPDQRRKQPLAVGDSRGEGVQAVVLASGVSPWAVRLAAGVLQAKGRITAWVLGGLVTEAEMLAVPWCKPAVASGEPVQPQLRQVPQWPLGPWAQDLVTL